VFPLLRYFSITSAVALLAATVLLTVLYRHTVVRDIVDHGETTNVALARSLWKTVGPEFGPFLTLARATGQEGQRSDPRLSQLQQVVEERIEGRSVFKVNIYNPDGLTVFSTEARQVGTDNSASPAVRRALSGEIATELAYRHSPRVFGHLVPDVDVISSYVPMFGPTGELAVVIEIYDDVSVATAHLHGPLTIAALMIAGLFAGVYLVLFLIVRRAGKILSHQHRQILDSQAELARKNQDLAEEIRERQRAEEALRGLNDDLEQRVAERSSQLRETREDLVRKQRLASLGQLIGSVCHDLRNPLGVIRNSLASIAETAAQTGLDLQRPLQRSGRSLERCEGIITEILDHTRVRELEMVPTTIDPWLGAVLDEQALPSGMALRRDLSAAGAEVPLDNDRFRRVVINLFDNACQAMTEDRETSGVAPRHCLTVTTRAPDDRVEISFSDTGPGIPPDVMSKVFEPLFTTKLTGVGLGLPMVKQIVEQHGGGMEISSERDRGTHVTLWLPLRGAAEEAA
jgi:signal transduction histidine kinase